MKPVVPPDLITRETIAIEVGGGLLSASVVRPRRSEPGPVVILCVEAPKHAPWGRALAQSLANRGYYVLLRFLEEGSLTSSRIGPGAVRHGARRVARETAAIIRHLDQDAMAMATEIAAIGFGVGAGYVIAAAAQEPARIKAVAAIDGPQMVTDQEDSPHRLVQFVAGEMYFAFSKRDDCLDADALGRLGKALEDCTAPYWLDSAADLEADVLAQEPAARNCDGSGPCQPSRLLELLGRRLPQPQACGVYGALTSDQP